MRGSYPYLQVLEEILSHTDTVSEVPLGLVQIPIDLIVGTYAVGRRTAFAPNFMPLLNPGTEFAYKWASLCDSHLSEGIRDPIKAYEFMNRFYVVEGNKRVSVLKYFDAVTIPGIVTRIIPKRTDEKENKIYYEFWIFTKSPTLITFGSAMREALPNFCSLSALIPHRHGQNGRKKISVPVTIVLPKPFRNEAENVSPSLPPMQCSYI